MHRGISVPRLAATLGLLGFLVGARDAQAQVAPPAGEAGEVRPGIERLSAVVQQRLQLTDEQTARLRATSQHYAEQRRALLRDERDARRTVRGEVSRGNAADQGRVQGALDRLYAIQQRRTELATSEQRELAGFLSPTQRAQYAGMQERAFRAAQAFRQRRDALDAAVPGAPQPNAERRAERAQQQAQRQAEREQQRQQQRQAEQAVHRAARAAGRHPH